ncbi:MAG: gliding motility lipoprotein GldH [Bacteroidaceae bacterium]|nr:gliding motility lipoprotein GldH [Bacteroidaceae bacterium]
MRITEVIMVGLVLTMVTSCDWDNTVYHRYYAVSDSWLQQEVVTFEFPVLEKGKTCYMEVDVRYSKSFPYHDLWLLIQHNVEDSISWKIDTIKCSLFNDVGFPSGDGLAGVFQLTTPFASLIPDGNSCTRLKVKHYMSDSLLRGITDIGIRVKQ